MGTLIDIYEWLTVGIYDFVTQAFAYLVEWMVVSAITTKIFMAKFAWDVAKNILINVGISDLIQSYWSTIPSENMNTFTFFRLPEVVNILLQAHVTRFVLSLF